MQHHRKFDPWGHDERGGRRNLLESVYSFQKFQTQQKMLLRMPKWHFLKNYKALVIKNIFLGSSESKTNFSFKKIKTTSLDS